MKKQRNSTIEILRIISMLGVLGLHYMNGSIGGGIKTTLPSNIVISHFLESTCITSVNVFVLISGYFMVTQQTMGIRKAIDLYLTMVAYHLLFFVIAIAIGEYSFSIKKLIIAICPFVVGQKWFLETYILLLLFAPFINRLISHLNRNSHLLLITLWMLIFSVWPSFFPSPPSTDNGYGISTFVTLYLVASFIKQYVKLNYSKRTVWRSLGIFAISVIIITLFSFTEFQDRSWGYCFLFNIIASTALFYAFLNLPKTSNSNINLVAGTTFGVYISHANIYLSNLIYHGVLHTHDYVDSALMPLHFFICILLQFAVFSIVERLRQFLWKPTIGKYLYNAKWLKNEEKWEKAVFSGS